jgi:hypothetical protein
MLKSDEEGKVAGELILRDGGGSKILLEMHLTEVEKEVIAAERDGPSGEKLGRNWVYWTFLAGTRESSTNVMDTLIENAQTNQ